MGKIEVFKSEYTGNWLWICLKDFCSHGITDEPDHIYWVDRESQQSALKGGLRHLRRYHSEKSV